ncbi:hypothetical protein [Kaarinaea lacus]
MKKNILTHIIAATTVAFGIWLFVGGQDTSRDMVDSLDSQTPKPPNNVNQSKSTASGKEASTAFLTEDNRAKPSVPQATPPQLAIAKTAPDRKVRNPEVIVDDYIMAWRNADKATASKLWATISSCEECLALLVDMIVNKNLEDGMMLELAIKMAALDTNTVLPVFDVLIDPAGNRSSAIILSEKMMENGRSELVTKIFEVIYKAQENGYENFARQLTWVISKVDNLEGLQPILDTVAGRTTATPDYADHVSNVFSKVVHNIPDSQNAAEVMASYYQSASSQEQQRLWQVVSKHEDTLVLLATSADRNGQNYEIEKYASAIAALPNQRAVDGLMKLHINVEYSPDYLSGMLEKSIKINPTIKVLHKLEDYMRNPDVALESRIFAAEGLLAIRDNRQARYILEKVINNPQYSDPELQAYIGGRL